MNKISSPLPTHNWRGTNKSRGHREQRRKPLPRTSWVHFTTSVCGWSIVISKPGTKYITGEFNTNTTGRWHIIWRADQKKNQRHNLAVTSWDFRRYRITVKCIIIIKKWQHFVIARKCHNYFPTNNTVNIFLNTVFHDRQQENDMSPLQDLLKTIFMTRYPYTSW